MPRLNEPTKEDLEHWAREADFEHYNKLPKSPEPTTDLLSELLGMSDLEKAKLCLRLLESMSEQYNEGITAQEKIRELVVLLKG